MFWGLPLEPSKKYSQKVENAFHISQATLDLKSCDLEPVQVVLEYEGNNFILAHLSKKLNILQVPLDINFEVGEQISFRTIGKGRVFLTGYTIMEPDDSFGDLLQGEEDSEEEDTTFEDSQTPGKRKKALTKSNEKKKKKMDETNEDEDDDGDFDSDESLEELRDTTMGDTVFDDDDDDDEEESDDQQSYDSVEFEDGSEDDSGSEEESDEEAEAEPAPAPTPKSDKKKKENQILNASVNGISSSKKDKKNKGKADNESPKKQNETPRKDGLSPKKEKQGKTPKQEIAQKKTPKSEKALKQGKTPNSTTPSPKRVLEGGVTIEEVSIGDGQVAKPGKMVTVYYSGRVQGGNKVFDSATKGPGFKFRLGKGEVIKGWDIGLNGMKLGGKRKITIPAPLAYGAKGCPPSIPPNSTLVFDVELRGVN